MAKDERDKKEWQQNSFINDICQKTWKDLYRYIYYKVQNREEAEDITQETYERTISFLKRENATILDYTNYLRAISLNIIRDRWRSKQRKGSNVNIDEVSAEEICVADFTDTINDRALIENALKGLSEDKYNVIRLRIIEGYSVAKTAQMLNKKEATVRVLTHRALKDLGKLLSDWKSKEEWNYE